MTTLPDIVKMTAGTVENDDTARHSGAGVTDWQAGF